MTEIVDHKCGIDDSEELIKFIRELNLLDIKFTSTFYEMLPLCGFGVVIGFSKFIFLHNRIRKAAFELVNAKKTNHNDLFGKIDENSLWQRGMHIENSIIDYNSITDLIYQTIYFRFDLFRVLDKVSIDAPEVINKLSEKVQGKKYGEIRKWLDSEISAKEFLLSFDEYLHDAARLKNTANDLKHRGSLVLNGLNLPRLTNVTKMINGKIVDITECVESPTIDIDEEIIYLSSIHKRSVELQRRLYYLCDFHGCLTDFLQKAGLNMKTDPIN